MTSTDKLQAPAFEWAFLSPRNWILWLWFAVLWLITRLPFPVVYHFGRGFGLLVMHLAPKRRAIAARNLELCFPEKTDTEREHILRESFAGAGLTIFESGLVWWPYKKFASRVEINGIEHIQRLREAGKPVLAFSLHNTPIEACLSALSFHAPFNALFRVHDNPLWEYISYRGRTRYNLQLVPRKQVKQLLALMNEREVGLILPDQDFGKRRSIFVPFFDIQTATVPSVTDFARQTDAAVVFINYYRKGPQGYGVEISAPLENFPSGDEQADTARTNQITEEAIRQHPGEYLWHHRRFKTRPEGEERIY
ncbi:lipid A biosynthesis lauroyl acyltransferase [Maricurvus nonylphenolicus]|uniref:LpxL/LpxP family Kdo(2)-lipid IV(A) lauroyl/palmitoleoyl acyltransferase n=1 Tax=Maricurvus nonylphenolicus TaxID=1008307 RepID=UPI0036F3C5B7